MEQSHDGRKFNRGKLLNAGFDITRHDFDVFVFHDVDLLPGVRSVVWRLDREMVWRHGCVTMSERSVGMHTQDDLGTYYAQLPERGPMHIAHVWDRYVLLVADRYVNWV